MQHFIQELVDRFGEAWLRRCPGFVDKNGRTTFRTFGDGEAYVVPYRDEKGLITGLQYKFVGGKYETARGSSTAEMYHMAGALEVGCDLYVTEGGVKAQVAHRLGDVAVIGLPGQSLSENHIAVIRQLNPKRVIVALDEESNVNTDRARDRWLRSLFHAGLSVYQAVWEGTDVSGPKGIDDLFFAGDRPRIRAVSFAPEGIGERRAVRPSEIRGWVTQGIPLASARQDTREAVFEFIEGRRR